MGLFQVSDYIESTNIPLAKSNQMAESKIRGQRGTLCLLVGGTRKSHGKGHRDKEWCHPSGFALNRLLCLTHNTLNIHNPKCREVSKVFKPFSSLIVKVPVIERSSKRGQEATPHLDQSPHF